MNRSILDRSGVLMAFLALCIMAFGLASPSRADIMLVTQPSSAPNAFGSPSWPAYVTNAQSSLAGNLGNIGNRSTDPTAYEIAGPYIDPGDIIVSGFDSWRGVASSSSPFNGQFGNRLHFGLVIEGGGTNPQFRLNDLAFNMTSGDSFNSLAYSGTFAGLDYNANRYGIDFGPDRVEGGGDDNIYTTGNGLTLVDKIVYVGVGNSFDATFEPGATNQDKIDSVLAYINSEGPFSIDCTYTMYAPNSTTILGTTSASVIVPTPGSVALGLIACVGFIRRRRAC